MHHWQPDPNGPSPRPNGLRPAVFFDRDGVVNACPGPGSYVLSWEQFTFNEGIIEALKLCRQRGYLTVLATSQQGVGKGLMSAAQLEEIHQRMQDHLRIHGAAFDCVKACTCLQSSPDCTCRKPSPEMLLQAAEECGIDLNRSLVIGDAPRDIVMGRNAGLPCSIRILGTKNEQEHPPATYQLHGTAGLPALLAELLHEQRDPSHP